MATRDAFSCYHDVTTLLICYCSYMPGDLLVMQLHLLHCPTECIDQVISQVTCAVSKGRKLKLFQCCN
jgi:hypothetical protein